MSGLTKEHEFESAIEQHLIGHGWLKSDPKGYDVGLGLVPEVLAEFLQVSQPDEWKQLVGRHGAEAKAVAKVCKRVADEITGRGTIDVLRRGVKDSGVSFQVAFFAPAHELTPDLRAKYDANRLTVVRQLHHSESNPKDSLDVVLFLNGIPVATAELKNPHTHQSVGDAVIQYRKDRNATDLIFKHRVVVNFAVDPDEVFMSTRLAGKDTVFLPFNEGSNGPGEPGGKGNPANPDGYRTSYLWERVWQRDAWLGLLENYVHVEDVYDDNGKKTGTRTLFPRFHQWDLVERLLAATRDAGPGVNRLAQHSAGSGKSNSIAWTAHRLSRLHTPGDASALSDAVKAAGLGPNEPMFHKVVVITDRKVLDSQLQATIAGFDHTPGTVKKIDKDSKQLRAALEGSTARIIITTLQKFPVVAEHATRVAGQRFAVIVDEAHSSTGGEAMVDLKKVLAATPAGGADDPAVLAAVEAAEAAVEASMKDVTDLLEENMAARGKRSNLSFFAFTATPKAKTLALFGEPVTGTDGTEAYRPFHTYSMRQAIEEGYILDVLANYTTYETYYRLANADPDSDLDVPVSKASKELARFVTLHPTNLAQKAEIIVEHFLAKTRHKIGGKAKAMVVTRSRLHAVRYKQAIDAYIKRKKYDTGPDPIKTLVAFSGTVTDPAAPAADPYTEPTMNGMPYEALPGRFDSDEYQVLIVAEKYQTGFDQPKLHTMYVDKELSGVKAVQTLSRLNRTHPGKSDTFVLDFANSAEDIVAAFAPFYEQTTATPTDPNLLYTWQRTLEDAGVLDKTEMDKAVTALLAGGPGRQQTVYANLNPAVDRFKTLTDDAQDAFRGTVNSYVRGYAFLSQTLSWTDPELERLYLYVRALQPLLPVGGVVPPTSLSESVILTHLRTEQTGAAAPPLTADDTPLDATPGNAEGGRVEEVYEPLSVLIQAMNDRFGVGTTEADRVWMVQQKQVVKDSPKAKIIALNNDRDQYEEFLRGWIEDAIVDRHMANGVLFNMFNDKPEFRDLLLEYIATTYDEFRADEATG